MSQGRVDNSRHSQLGPQLSCSAHAAKILESEAHIGGRWTFFCDTVELVARSRRQTTNGVLGQLNGGLPDLAASAGTGVALAETGRLGALPAAGSVPLLEDWRTARPPAAGAQPGTPKSVIVLETWKRAVQEAVAIPAELLGKVGELSARHKKDLLQQAGTVVVLRSGAARTQSGMRGTSHSTGSVPRPIRCQPSIAVAAGRRRQGGLRGHLRAGRVRTAVQLRKPLLG